MLVNFCAYVIFRFPIKSLGFTFRDVRVTELLGILVLDIIRYTVNNIVDVDVRIIRYDPFVWVAIIVYAIDPVDVPLVG